MANDAPRQNPLVPILLAVGIGAGAASYLLLDHPAPRPAAPVTGPVPAVARLRPPSEADEIETVRGLPGYGVFDGSAYQPSPEAERLAAGASVAELAERLRQSPEAGRADVAAALAVKSSGRADVQTIAQALGPLAASPDRGVRHAALAGLLQTGDPGVDAMLAALGTAGMPAAGTPAAADLLSALKQIEPQSQLTIDSVTKRLFGASDPSVALGAARALEGMGDDGTAALRQAVAQLRQGNNRALTPSLVEELQRMVSQLDQIEGFGPAKSTQ